MVAILVIAYSLLVLILCIAVFGKKGKEEDNNLKRMKSIGKEVVTAEYKNIESSFYDRNIKPLVTKLSNLDSQGNKQTKSARKRQETEKLALQLRKAGIHMSTGSFTYLKTAVAVVGVIVFFRHRHFAYECNKLLLVDYYSRKYVVGACTYICS